MSKFTQLKAVAVVASACTALFVAAPASAHTYAVSQLQLKDLDLSITPAGGGADVGAATNYSFTLNNNASFKPTGGVSKKDSSSNSCSGVAGGANDCGFSPVLDSDVANAPGLLNARAENNFSVLGINANQSYSNADSQITTAKLVTGGKTNTVQIAESLLNINGQAFADTEVKSTTTLVTSFSTSTLTDLNITFEALLKLAGEINDKPGGIYTSQAGSAVKLSLQKTGSNGNWTWTPDGGSDGCTGGGFGFGSTCLELSDTWNLNNDKSIKGNPESFDFSSNSFKAFGLRIANLVAGDYSLTLTANTTTYVDRKFVPEPGSLALVGLALAGLGLASKRRTRISK